MNSFRQAHRQTVFVSVSLLTALVFVLYLEHSGTIVKSKFGSEITHNNDIHIPIQLKRKDVIQISLFDGEQEAEVKDVYARKLKHVSSQQLNYPRYENTSKSEITVVTAFFDIGIISKWGGIWRSPKTYRNWMWKFRQIENPIVAYFDSALHALHFKRVRSYLPRNRTKIIIIKRRDLRSFSFKNKINDILHRHDYPESIRENLKPEYPCIMHSKYELMQRSVIKNYHKTEYFAWIDIGLFRDLKDDRQFNVALPPNFRDNTIAYGQVMNVTSEEKLQTIFYNTSVWLCGCIFIGKLERMLLWTSEYLKYAELFLDMGYVGTDEQVLFAMHSTNFRQSLSVKLQVYLPVAKYGPWFTLGYLCIEQWNLYKN